MKEVKVYDYNVEKLKSYLEDSLDYYNLDLNRSSTLVIKLDLYSGKKTYNSGATINLTLVENLITVLNTRYSPKVIFLAEGANTVDVDDLFDVLGYRELARKFNNVKLLNLNKDETVKLLNLKFSILKIVVFPQMLITCDCFISVSNLKRHITERISGSYLNLFTCIPNKMFRIRLQGLMFKVLWDLFGLLAPSLNIVDANYGYYENGPVEGYPKKIGKLIIGNNPIVTDCVAAKMIGDFWKDIPSLKYAVRKYSKIDKSLKKKLKKILKSLNEDSIDSLPFTGNFNYLMIRVSLWFKRTSLYMENMSVFFYLGALALISIGGKDLIRGRWMSFNHYFNIIKEVILKVDEPTNLLNWKIVINKHVKEESLS